MFDAERRCIDIAHNLLWMDNALDVLAEIQRKARPSTSPSWR